MYYSRAQIADSEVLPVRLVPAFLLSIVIIITSGCGGGSNSDEPDAHVPQPDAAPPLVSRQEVVEACLRSDACRVMPFGYLSLCVTSHYDDLFRTSQVGMWSAIYRCVNQAGGDCQLD